MKAIYIRLTLTSPLKPVVSEDHLLLPHLPSITSPDVTISCWYIIPKRTIGDDNLSKTDLLDKVERILIDWIIINFYNYY